MLNKHSILIYFGILLLVGLLADRTFLESIGIVIMVFGGCFILVGIVLSLIYFTDK